MNISKIIIWKDGGIAETPFGNYFIRENKNIWIGEFRNKDYEYYMEFITSSDSKESVIKECQSHFENQVLDLLNKDIKSELDKLCLFSGSY